MKGITLQELDYFQIAIKCASFSQAAKIAFTSQSNISKNINSLEKALGEKLFIRQNKGIMPTQKAILFNLELNETKNRISELFNLAESREVQSLDIGFCQSIDFPFCIPEFFNVFARENDFGNLEFGFACEEVNDIIEGVISGKYDLGFILSDINISTPSIKMRNVIVSSPKIYFSKNSPLNRKDRIMLADLSEYPLVTTKYLIQHNDYRMVNSLPFNPRSIKVVNSYDEIPLYLATGKYITLLRPYVYLATNKNIVEYPLPDYEIRQGITMIWLVSNSNKNLFRLLKILRAYRTESVPGLVQPERE